MAGRFAASEEKLISGSDDRAILDMVQLASFEKLVSGYCPKPSSGQLYLQSYWVCLNGVHDGSGSDAPRGSLPNILGSGCCSVVRKKAPARENGKEQAQCPPQQRC